MFLLILRHDHMSRFMLHTWMEWECVPYAEVPLYYHTKKTNIFYCPVFPRRQMILWSSKDVQTFLSILPSFSSLPCTSVSCHLFYLSCLSHLAVLFSSNPQPTSTHFIVHLLIFILMYCISRLCVALSNIFPCC